MTFSPRSLIAAAAFLGLAACGGREDPNAPPEPFGDFLLGYTIIVPDQAQVAGPSREATPAEWEAVLKDEIVKRLGRYQGQKYYHLGIKIDAYALAYPGIPVVLNPKSVLVLSVSVWDDAAQRKINPTPKQILVFEPFSGATLVGSGLTQNKDQQMRSLSAAAARKINDWLVENKAWFTPEAAAARAILPKTGLAIVPESAPGAREAAAAAGAPPAAAPAPRAPAAGPAAAGSKGN